MKSKSNQWIHYHLMFFWSTWVNHCY